MALRHWDIVVTGRVQGVGYRQWVMKVARELELYGQVRNRQDGSVLIEAEGPEGRLRELVARCRQGPPLAQVHQVDARDGAITGAREFAIGR